MLNGVTKTLQWIFPNEFVYPSEKNKNIIEKIEKNRFFRSLQNYTRASLFHRWRVTVARIVVDAFLCQRKRSPWRSFRPRWTTLWKGMQQKSPGMCVAPGTEMSRFLWNPKVTIPASQSRKQWRICGRCFKVSTLIRFSSVSNEYSSIIYSSNLFASPAKIGWNFGTISEDNFIADAKEMIRRWALI